MPSENYFPTFNRKLNHKFYAGQFNENMLPKLLKIFLVAGSINICVMVSARMFITFWDLNCVTKLLRQYQLIWVKLWALDQEEYHSIIAQGG